MFSNCVTKMSKNVRQTASHQHPAPAEPLKERWGSGVTGSPKALPLEHMEEHSVPSTVWHLMEHQYQRANTTRTEENICFPTQSGSAPWIPRSCCLWHCFNYNNKKNNVIKAEWSMLYFCVWAYLKGVVRDFGHRTSFPSEPVCYLSLETVCNNFHSILAVAEISGARLEQV